MFIDFAWPMWRYPFGSGGKRVLTFPAFQMQMCWCQIEFDHENDVVLRLAWKEGNLWCGWWSVTVICWCAANSSGVLTAEASSLPTSTEVSPVALAISLVQLVRQALRSHSLLEWGGGSTPLSSPKTQPHNNKARQMRNGIYIYSCTYFIKLEYFLSAEIIVLLRYMYYVCSSSFVGELVSVPVFSC